MRRAFLEGQRRVTVTAVTETTTSRGLRGQDYGISASLSSVGCAAVIITTKRWPQT